MKRGESCARMSSTHENIGWCGVERDRSRETTHQWSSNKRAKPKMQHEGVRWAGGRRRNGGGGVGHDDAAFYLFLHKVNVDGRARRQRGWWKRGDIETKLNTVNMTAWVHEECDIMDDDALFRLQTARNNPQQKDECSVCLNDLESEPTGRVLK